MSFKTFVKRNSDGTYSLDEGRSTGHAVVDLLKTPIGMIGGSSNDKFESREFVAYATLLWAFVGFLAGEQVGHNRAATGHNSLLSHVPILNLLPGVAA